MSFKHKHFVVGMECPWGCGWKGDPSEYLKHLETCTKYPKAKKPLTHEEKVHKFLEEEATREKAAETPVEEPSPEETWLIRDETHVKVEPADKEVAVEEPLETPTEETPKEVVEETSEETPEEAGEASEE